MKGDIFHDPLFLAGLKRGGAGGSASGDIVTFNAPKAAPLRSLLVNIDPVQDLHGYESPWPSGGGKNKFNGTFLQGYWAYADGRWTDSNAWITTEKIPCKPSTYYTVSAVNNLTRWQGFVWYDENGDYISTTNQQANQNIGYTAESPATAAYMAYNIAGYPNTSSTISPSDVSQFQIEEGRNATTYAPYSNLCPISGWSECNVWRTGKNLAKLSSENAGDNQRSTVSYTDSGAVVTATGTYGRYGWQIPVKTGSTYTISYKAVASDAGNNNKIYFGSKTAWSVTSDGFLSWQKVTTTEVQYSVTVTIPSDTLFIGLYVSGLGTSGSITISDLQLELSSTATPYAPYTGNQYTIQLGQTVYGGTLDVVNGVLTVDRANIASYNGETLPGEWISDRDVYAPGTTPTIGAQVVYELATPITIPLSDITISTLAGQNVVWADCGDIAVEWAGGKGFGKEAMLAWVMHR